jgi:hypothetical protein
VGLLFLHRENKSELNNLKEAMDKLTLGRILLDY